MLIVVAGMGALAFESRHLTFFADDLSLVVGRRGMSLTVLLTPHTEHLIVGPILTYKVLLHLFGATSYWPFIGLAIVLNALCAVLLYVAARRRVGRWAALAPAAILIVLGPAWQDLLWAFQMGFFGSIAAGIGAFLLLDRRDRIGDALACLLLIVSVAWGSIGVGVMAGIAVELVLQRRRDGLRRLWLVAVPVVLYGLWYIGYGTGAMKASNITLVPSYVLDGFSGALGSIAGLAQTPAGADPYEIGLGWGRPLAVLALLLLIGRIVRGRPMTVRFWSLTVTGVALWIAAALAYFPSRDAAQSRYQYIGVAFVLLAAVELAPGWRPNVRAGLLITLATAAAVVANLGILRDHTGFWTTNSQFSQAEISMIQIARGTVAPSFTPEDPATGAVIGNHDMYPIVAGPYFSAADKFGSLAISPERVARLPENVRLAADFVLAHAERLGLVPAERTPAGARCQTLTSAVGAASLTLSPGTTTFRFPRGTTATVALRRFADTFSYVTFPVITAGGTWSLTLPQDGAPRTPWLLDVVTSRPGRLCAGGTP